MNEDPKVSATWEADKASGTPGKYATVDSVTGKLNVDVDRWLQDLFIIRAGGTRAEELKALQRARSDEAIAKLKTLGSVGRILAWLLTKAYAWLDARSTS